MADGRPQTAPMTGDRVEALEQMASIADELGADTVARDARDLSSRVLEGRFFLAVVGQFKRGKSTLLNALVGDALLPTGVAPVTCAITVLRFGPRLKADVVFKDGRRQMIEPADIHRFVTEADNPENRLQIAAVEIFCPSPLLASGMCFVDTPGLGSVFQGNTDETRAFVPHIDAALVVLGADPPISGEELSLVATVATQVPDIVVVLNKADRLRAPELAEARQFTEHVLARGLAGRLTRVYEVSASERMERGPTREWVSMESRLRELAGDAGDVVATAAERGVARVAARVRHEIGEQRLALERPLAESERRIESLQTSRIRAEQLLRDLAALFQSEEQRVISDALESPHAAYVRQAKTVIESELRDGVAGFPRSTSIAALRMSAYTLARDIVHRHVSAWLKQLEPDAERAYQRAASRFVGLGNEFLQSLVRSGDSAFVHLPHALDPTIGFRAPRHFMFTDLMYMTGDSPLNWIADYLRGRSRTVHAVTDDAWAYAERLLVTNSSRVMFDIRERVSESRAALEKELRSLLTDLTASAARALASARDLLKRGDEAVAARRVWLEDCEARLERLSHADRRP